MLAGLAVREEDLVKRSILDLKKISQDLLVYVESCKKRWCDVFRLATNKRKLGLQLLGDVVVLLMGFLASFLKS